MACNQLASRDFTVRANLFVVAERGQITGSRFFGPPYLKSATWWADLWPHRHGTSTYPWTRVESHRPPPTHWIRAKFKETLGADHSIHGGGGGYGVFFILFPLWIRTRYFPPLGHGTFHRVAELFIFFHVWWEQTSAEQTLKNPQKHSSPRYPMVRPLLVSKKLNKKANYWIRSTSSVEKENHNDKKITMIRMINYWWCHRLDSTPWEKVPKNALITMITVLSPGFIFLDTRRIILNTNVLTEIWRLVSKFVINYELGTMINVTCATN